MNVLRAEPAALVTADTGPLDEDRPAYAVVNRYAAFEIRQYAPYIMIEVTVPGPAGEVASRRLGLLSAYISGANKGRGLLAMTASVTNAPEPARLPMTAPVTQRADPTTGDSSDCIVQFTMPRGAALATLPTPDHARVHLHELPGKLYAVSTYSGRRTQANDPDHADALCKAAVDAGLKPVGEPVVARYDAPFVPPPLRHNEMWLSLAP